MEKIKIFEGTLIGKGQIIDYQTVVEQNFGDVIAGIKEYDSNLDNKKKYPEKGRAFFETDYDTQIEITITRVKGKIKEGRKWFGGGKHNEL